MKRKIELLLLILFYLLFGLFLIKTDERSIFQLLYTSFLYLSSGAILFTNLYHLFPLLKKGLIRKYLLLNIVLLLITYSLSAFLYASWMAEVYDYEFLLSHLIHPTILQDILPLLLTIWVVSTGYASIRHLILSGKFRLLRKITTYAATVVLLFGLIFFINYQVDLNYEGDKKILFIEDQYNSLDEIVQLPQFHNKVVYVDLWFSSCTPCIKEFQHLSGLKKELYGKEVEYLYLARETSHPNSVQRWKNAIKKFNLQGWHVYMNNNLVQQTWQTIVTNQGDSISEVYPHYLLVDRNGNISSYNAKRPSTGQEVIKEIEALLQ